MVSALERQREENLRRNRELLLQLGLDAPIVPAATAAPKSPAKKKVAAPRKSAASKRRISEVQDGDGEDAASPSPKRAAVAAVVDSPSGVRRSSRHAGKPRVSYTDEIITLTEAPAPAPVKAVKRIKHEGDVDGMDVEKEGRAEHVGNRLGKRMYNPKTYGSIPGVEVGTWWETRAQCSTDAIHAPFVAGISAGPQGAYSIALSGGYEDDVDLGYAFTYTGSGGRDLKGTPQNRKNLRTAPQSSHQTWENTFNAALKRSVETKKPVRVIRGYKLQSEWAPATGYRYDGLYRVEKAWMERGLNPGGFQVCKFALKRMDGQPALPKREPGAAAAAAAKSDDEDGPEDEDEEQGDEAEEKTAMDVDTVMTTTTNASSVADAGGSTKATTPDDEAPSTSGKQGATAEKPTADDMDVDATGASADKIESTTDGTAKVAHDKEDNVAAEPVSAAQIPPAEEQPMEVSAAAEPPVEDGASEPVAQAIDASAAATNNGTPAQDSTTGSDLNVAAAPNDVAADAAMVEEVASAMPVATSADNSVVSTAVEPPSSNEGAAVTATATAAEEPSPSVVVEPPSTTEVTAAPMVEDQTPLTANDVPTDPATVDEVPSATPTERPVSDVADDGDVTTISEPPSSNEIAVAAAAVDKALATAADDPSPPAPPAAAAAAAQADSSPKLNGLPVASVEEQFPLSSLRD